MAIDNRSRDGARVSGLQIIVYRPGGPFATITLMATILVALLVGAAAAAILLVIAALFAAGVVLANALLPRLRRRSGSWPDRSIWTVDERTSREPPPAAVQRPATAVATAYLPLSTYLERRHASNVVLTFEQIESLLGFSLPAPASTEREWWTAEGGDIGGHAVTWTVAGRTATPNLPARTVAFNRLP